MLYSEYCITLPPSEFTKPSGKPSIFGSFRKEIARFSISSRWSARKDGGNRRERDGNSLGAYSPLAALGNLGSPWKPWKPLAVGVGSHGNMSISLRMGCAAPKLWLFNLSENGNMLRITENPWELGEPHVQTNPWVFWSKQATVFFVNVDVKRPSLLVALYFFL